MSSIPVPKSIFSRFGQSKKAPGRIVVIVDGRVIFLTLHPQKAFEIIELTPSGINISPFRNEGYFTSVDPSLVYTAPSMLL